MSKKVKMGLLLTILLVIIGLGITLFVCFAPNRVGSGTSQTLGIPANSISKPQESTNSASTPHMTAPYQESVTASLKLVEPQLQNSLLYYGMIPAYVDVNPDGTPSIRKLADGKVLPLSLNVFEGHPIRYCFDVEANFWGAYYDEKQNAIVVTKYDTEGTSLRENILLQECFIAKDYIGNSIKKLVVSSENIYVSYEKDAQYDILQVYTLDGVKVNEQEVLDFDVSRNGEVCLTNNAEDGYCYLEKRSADLTKTIWKQSVLTKEPGKLCAARSSETLYLLHDKGIDAFALEDGFHNSNLLNMTRDTGLVFSAMYRENIQFLDFKVDENETFYLQFLQTMTRDITIYQYDRKDSAEVPILDTITLTAPYPQDFLLDAIASYQRDFPGHRVALDSAYATRDEFQAHGEQYGEKLALRILSNDIGDVVMTLGSALKPENILRTDAFLDLTDLLLKDPNVSGLNQNVLNSLRFDETLRALPIGVIYNYCEWNATLADMYNVKADPQTLRWSDLLQIAKQWEQDSVDASLFAGWKDSSEFLYWLLLSNCRDLIRVSDSTFDLKQPWFMDLLKEWKGLQNSPSLFQKYPDQIDDRTGLLPTTLIAVQELENPMQYTDTEASVRNVEEILGIDIRYVPVIAGEMNNNRTAYSINAYSISNHSTQKEAAWSFLSSLLGSKMQTLPSLNGTPVNFQVEKERFQSELEMKTGLSSNFFSSMEMIYKEVDFLYEPSRLYQNVFEPILGYMQGAITLEQSLDQAEHNLWLQMNE